MSPDSETSMVDPAALSVGAELPPFVVETVDPQRMKTMAALLDDPNPIHFDTDLVVRLGYGTAPINQGPITMSYLMNVVTDAFGREAIRSFRCRFLGNVFAGERVVCRGTVSALDAAAGTAEIELSAVVGDRPVLAGAVTVALPD
jgi:acyl dehydratase